MLQWILISLIASLIPTLLLIAALSLSMHSKFDKEKSSPFECGFDPKNNARLPFSSRFFLLAVIFLVFDVEIALLLPWPLALNQKFPILPALSALLFLLILLAGLLHEWNEGSLEWTH